MTARNWSTTAANNNSAPPFGAPEGQTPSSVNNVIRQIMADARDTFEQLPWFDFGHTPTRIDNDTFTVSTDLTATYAAGRRLKLVGATTGYATISSSSYSAPNTTVNVTMDSGNVPTSLSTVSLGTDFNNAISSLPSTVLKIDTTAAEVSAGVTVVNFFYSPGHVRRYGNNTIPGVTDMTSAMLATISQAKAGGASAYWPADTYLVTQLIADGSNYSIRTDGGRGTILKQAAGQTDKPILVVRGQNITVGDLAGQGTLQTDGLANTHEFNHLVYAYDDTNTQSIRASFGNLYGTDIRGDVLYAGSPSSSRPCYVTYETVSGTNVFRNLVSSVGAKISGKRIIHDGPVGYRDFDVEPNAGSNYSTDFRVDYVEAGCVQFASNEPTLSNSGTIGTLDLDFTRVAATTPAYRTPPGVNAQGMVITYAHYLKIGYLKTRNYNYAPITSNTATIKSNIYVDEYDFGNCSVTETTFKSLVADQGSGGIAYLEVGRLTGTLFDNTKLCFNGNGMRVRVRSGDVTGGLLAVAVPNSDFENITLDVGSSTGNILESCSSSTIKNLTLANASSATLFRSCTGCTIENVTGTVSAIEGAGCSDNRVIHSTLNSIEYTQALLSGEFLSKAMTDANQTLSAVEAQAVLIRCTGALTAQRNLVVPTTVRSYAIDNSTSGGFGVQVIGATGTGTVVAAGKKATVCHDGTNVTRVGPDT